MATPAKGKKQEKTGLDLSKLALPGAMATPGIQSDKKRDPSPCLLTKMTCLADKTNHPVKRAESQ